MICADNLVSKGYCLANPGEEYVVALNKAEPFTLKLEGLKNPLPAKWFQPLTGKYTDAGKLSSGLQNLTPPPSWGDAPLVLHVGGQ